MLPRLTLFIFWISKCCWFLSSLIWRFLACSISQLSSLSFSISLRSLFTSSSAALLLFAVRESCLLFQISTSDFFWLISLANLSFSLRSWVLCLSIMSIFSSNSFIFLPLAFKMPTSSTREMFSCSRFLMSTSKDYEPPVLDPVALKGLVDDLFIFLTLNIILITINLTPPINMLQLAKILFWAWRIYSPQS